jgi:AraC-like DNA-binding protein
MLNRDIYKRLFKAKEFIDDSFSEPINLDEIARKANFSRFHFLRLFQKVYNTTPHRYLTDKRIEKAKQLLKSDSINVTEICFEVGFESLGSFSTLFNKNTGFSPTAYREEILRKVLVSVRFPEKLIPGCFLSFYSR